MNEVKKIHIGRQPFTISVDAHGQLQGYLRAIERKVGKDTEVVKEVEARMVELLMERGVTSERVILTEDVVFLKEQLGTPGDFQEDISETAGTANDEAAEEERAYPYTDKRLYRDTDNAMIAGVASGLAAYFRIDPLIVRLLFVVLAFSGGAGILLYILLWILVPEAKTPSERLHMRGKAVTVDSIKEAIDRTVTQADVRGAAYRVRHGVRQVLNGIFRVLFGIIGIGLAMVGAAVFLGAMIIGAYMLIHGAQMGSEIVFPLGSTEVIGLVSAIIAMTMIALLLLLTGIATVRRKSVVSGWIMATVIGVFLLSASLATAIGFDTAPRLQREFHSMRHQQTLDQTSFTKLQLEGSETDYVIRQADTYRVTVEYFGATYDMNEIIKQKDPNTLAINTQGYIENYKKSCDIMCIAPDNVRVTIYAPSLDAIQVFSAQDQYINADTAYQNIIRN